MAASLRGQMRQSIMFARGVSQVFHRDPRARAHKEVPAFDALIAALGTQSSVAAVRFHGRKHVEFAKRPCTGPNLRSSCS